MIPLSPNFQDVSSFQIGTKVQRNKFSVFLLFPFGEEIFLPDVMRVLQRVPVPVSMPAPAFVSVAVSVSVSVSFCPCARIDRCPCQVAIWTKEINLPSNILTVQVPKQTQYTGG